MFWLRNKKNNFQLRTLIWGPVNYYICISSKRRVSQTVYTQIRLLLMEQAAQVLHCLSFQNNISHSTEWIRKMLLHLTVNTLCHSILISHNLYDMEKNLSHDVTSGSDVTPCNKIDKPLVVYLQI